MAARTEEEQNMASEVRGVLAKDDTTRRDGTPDVAHGVRDRR
jgi:hypothetical protein